MFYYIFDKGIYPMSWCNGVVVPIFKKGDRSCAETYRGITLINVVAKIFSTLLRNRLNKWCEEKKTSSIKHNLVSVTKEVLLIVYIYIYYILLFKMCYTTTLNCIVLLLIMRRHLIL